MAANTGLTSPKLVIKIADQYRIAKNTSVVGL